MLASCLCTFLYMPLYILPPFRICVFCIFVYALQHGHVYVFMPLTTLCFQCKSLRPHIALTTTKPLTKDLQYQSSKLLSLAIEAYLLSHHFPERFRIYTRATISLLSYRASHSSPIDIYDSPCIRYLGRPA